MYKVKIFSVGKSKECWLQEALKEYLKRLKPLMKVEFINLKDDQQLLNHIAKEPTKPICLDPAGHEHASREFHHFFYQRLIEGGSQVTFVIGGPDGLPPPLRKKAYLLSLSKLTFTHQISRLILIEQIYRATEIEKGSNYDK
ncbi:MAG: 23S rRNA (pseudouridine(1915)-N(3))-methyltransferase RlmH [Chlamydiota bacterium]